jgi:hypothetical protein
MKGLLQIVEMRKATNNPINLSQERGIFWYVKGSLIILYVTLYITVYTTPSTVVCTILMMHHSTYRADQTGSVLLSCPRFFDITWFPFITHPELLSRPSASRSLPPGFQANRAILTNSLIDVIKDMLDLQCELSSQTGFNVTIYTMTLFNDAAASVQYRLSTMSASSIQFNCARLACYVVSCAIFPVMFGVPPMPIFLSVQLGQALMASDLQNDWTRHIDLLLWVIFVGGTFARITPMYPLYVGMLRGLLGELGDLCGTWERTRVLLKMFVWEEKVFGRPCEELWVEAVKGLKGGKVEGEAEGGEQKPAEGTEGTEEEE